jgi:alkanesulfonate monooxygenase SsuD/methylene tetrahydromethanopterin reductase-like flavin-dependent oxidoreductase (luciferase family)
VMRMGVVLPGGSAVEQLQQAVLAEEHGWDGVFVWEAAYGVDAWSLLAAIAARTTSIRIGTMLTPLPWRRPWKVASQVATVDQLSGGRTILAVGIGATDTELPQTGEVTDLRGRAERLDEGIDLIRQLWSGGTSFHGQHYDYDGAARSDLVDVVEPIQRPIPIWVVGVWQRPKSMRRALRCEGLIPQYQLEEGAAPAPEHARAVRAYLDEHAEGHVELISEGEMRHHGGGPHGRGPGTDRSGAAEGVIGSSRRAQASRRPRSTPPRTSRARV